MSRTRLAALAILVTLGMVVACGAGGSPSPVGPAEPAPATPLLTGYRATLGPVIIDGVEDNASGLTWSPVTGTLFLVLNNPTVVVELDLRGNVKRTIPLTGFDDTEGIAHVRQDVFGIAEEGRNTIVTVRIAPETREIAYGDCAKTRIDPAPGGNTGLEGLAWDAKNGRFFGVREMGPRKLYVLPGPTAERPGPEIGHPWDIEETHLGMRDLSGVYYHAASGHLLLLSHESHCIVECTTEGTEVSRLALKARSAGLEATPPQPEGITMDAEGNLYVCSEPNLFYVFTKPSRQPSPPPGDPTGR